MENFGLIQLASENHVAIVWVPPQATHKLQPLGRSFMGPLKANCSEEIRIRLRVDNSPQTLYDISEPFGRSYLNVQTG
jgi:hypothetical protein